MCIQHLLRDLVKAYLLVFINGPQVQGQFTCPEIGHFNAPCPKTLRTTNLYGGKADYYMQSHMASSYLSWYALWPFISLPSVWVNSRQSFRANSK